MTLQPSPCPFCGSEPKLIALTESDGFVSEYWVRCDECAISFSGEYKSDAIEAWNRRAALASQAQPVPQAIESLVSALAESRGWMRDYSRSIIEAAIEREPPDSFHQAQPSGEAATVQVQELDVAGNPKLVPTVLECLAIGALNRVKAWRDSDGNEPFPHEARELVEAALMMAAMRRKGVQ